MVLNLRCYDSERLCGKTVWSQRRIGDFREWWCVEQSSADKKKMSLNTQSRQSAAPFRHITYCRTSESESEYEANGTRSRISPLPRGDCTAPGATRFYPGWRIFVLPIVSLAFRQSWDGEPRFVAHGKYRTERLKRRGGRPKYKESTQSLFSGVLPC